MKSRFIDQKIFIFIFFPGFFYLVNMILFTHPVYAGPGEVIHGRVVYTRPDGVEIPINGVQIVAHSEWTNRDRDDPNTPPTIETEDHKYITSECGKGDVYQGHGQWDQYEDCTGGQYVYTLSCGRPDWKIQVLGLAPGVVLPQGVPPGGTFVPQSQSAGVTDNTGISSAPHVQYLPPASALPKPTPKISISNYILPTMEFMGIKLGTWPSPIIIK